MKLSEEQKKGVMNLFGSDTASGENAVASIEKTKGKFRIFNEDGSVNITVEELEKKLNKQPKVKKSVANSEISNEICADINKVIIGIKLMKDLKDYDKIATTLKLAITALKNKKEELKQAEIDRLTAEIEELTNKKNQLMGKE